MKAHSWYDCDPNKESRAVVANGEHGGTVLWHVGFHIGFKIEEERLQALNDLGLDDAPTGISVWEGIRYPSVHLRSHKCAVSEGMFRKPTSEEWLLIQQGTPPWNCEEWRCPNCHEDDAKAVEDGCCHGDCKHAEYAGAEAIGTFSDYDDRPPPQYSTYKCDIDGMARFKFDECRYPDNRALYKTTRTRYDD